MNVLVTGADGFVGRRAVTRLAAEGHTVTAAVRPEGTEALAGAQVTVALELRDDASVESVAATRFDAVLHLAGVASGADARRDPMTAWEINAVGTARLMNALQGSRAADGGPQVVVASTAEVYGVGCGVPRKETDAVAPCSPYAASKLGAEVAAGEVWRRAGLDVVIARAFPHTGAGQDTRFVVPAFARRLAEARTADVRRISVGNLDPVRDILHVDDVVDAYVVLLEQGMPGETYNIASGVGVSLREVLDRLAKRFHMKVEPVPDPDLVRPADIDHLVGDPSKLRQETGWASTRTLDAALEEVVGAKAH